MSRPQCSTPGCTGYAYRFNGQMLCEDCAQAAGLSACGTSCKEDLPAIGVVDAEDDIIKPVNTIKTVCELWNAKHKRKMTRHIAVRLELSAMKKIEMALSGRF